MTPAAGGRRWPGRGRCWGCVGTPAPGPSPHSHPEQPTQCHIWPQPTRPAGCPRVSVASTLWPLQTNVPQPRLRTPSSPLGHRFPPGSAQSGQTRRCCSPVSTGCCGSLFSQLGHVQPHAGTWKMPFLAGRLLPTGRAAGTPGERGAPRGPAAGTTSETRGQSTQIFGAEEHPG